MVIFSKVIAEVAPDLIPTLPGETIELKKKFFADAIASVPGGLTATSWQVKVESFDNNLTVIGGWNDVAAIKKFLEHWINFSEQEKCVENSSQHGESVSSVAQTADSIDKLESVVTPKEEPITPQKHLFVEEDPRPDDKSACGQETDEEENTVEIPNRRKSQSKSDLSYSDDDNDGPDSPADIFSSSNFPVFPGGERIQNEESDNDTASEIETVNATPPEPSEPAEPFEPSEPAEPFEPSEPAEPFEPSEPVEPVEPAEPAEVKPVEPVEVKPVEVKPVEPIEVKPVEPTPLPSRRRRKPRFPAKLSMPENGENDPDNGLSEFKQEEPHDTNNSAPLFTLVKRKRGRPKKHPPNFYNENNLSGEIALESISFKEPLPKKRRGRPRIHPPGMKVPRKRYPPKYEECGCPECGFKTTNRKNLAEHMKGNHREKIYKCPICDKMFCTKNRLNMHVKYHTECGSFCCDICGRTLSSSTALQLHLFKKHDGPQPKCLPKTVLCITCGKLCRNANDHEIHMNKEHTKVAPYMCDLCGKAFFGKVLLQSHRREVHETDYKIQCSDCGKLFKRQNNLNAHKVIHEAERPYKCQVCNKGFTQSSALIRHTRIHTGERPFKCCLCGSQSNAYSILRRHLQGIHKITDPAEIRATIRKCKEMYPTGSVLMPPCTQGPAQGEETPKKSNVAPNFPYEKDGAKKLNYDMPQESEPSSQMSMMSQMGESSQVPTMAENLSVSSARNTGTAPSSQHELLPIQMPPQPPSLAGQIAQNMIHGSMPPEAHNQHNQGQRDIPWKTVLGALGMEGHWAPGYPAPWPPGGGYYQQ